MSSDTPFASGSDPERTLVSPRGLGLGVFLLALLPVLSAVWSNRWFVTQDGPAHLYNAQIIARSSDPQSPYREVFRVRWDPLPNWIGHLSLAVLLGVLPPGVVDRVMTSLTLAGFAGSLVWLRWRVVGWRGMPGAALFAVLLAMNLPWLLGFTSFLLGACLFPLTLGLWWETRSRPGPGQVGTLWALMVLGYFCHLVSLGLTVVGLGVLVLLAPGDRRVVRAGWTALGLAPLVPLGLVYLGLTRRGGPMTPVWESLPDPFSPRAWATQLAWADPLSLARKVVIPFVPMTSLSFVALAPVVGFLVALGLQGCAMFGRRVEPGPDRRVWGVLAVLLIAAGVAGPDTLGPSHGNYLPQRVVLLGLAALVPLLDFEAASWCGRGAIAALGWAVAVQSGFVWEYGVTSNRDVGALVRAEGTLGHRQRVATLLTGIRGRFRANPLLHADCLLGVETGNILWSNYETRYYYFPVQLRTPRDCPDSTDLERIALLDDPRDAAERARLWTDLLEAHHDVIDRILVWGQDPALEPISARWYTTVYREGNVRVLERWVAPAGPRP